jgi:hypothetical protein
MKPSDIKKILESSFSKVTRFNLFRSYLAPKEVLELQNFYASLLLNPRDPDAHLTPGQMYELYAQYMLKPNATGEQSKISEEIYTALAPAETAEDRSLKIRVKKIHAIGCLPLIANKKINFEGLSGFITRLPINLVVPKYLNSIFFVFDKIPLRPHTNYLLEFPVSMMTEANFDALGLRLGYDEPNSYLGKALDNLPTSLLATPAYFNHLVTSPNLCLVIAHLRKTFITINSFERINKHRDILAASNINLIPKNLFIQAHFDHISKVCDSNKFTPTQKSKQIRDYINQQILGKKPRIKLNAPETTMTTSVHESASDAANKLNIKFGVAINTPEKLLSLINKIIVVIRDTLPQGRNTLKALTQDMDALKSDHRKMRSELQKTQNLSKITELERTYIIQYRDLTDKIAARKALNFQTPKAIAALNRLLEPDNLCAAYAPEKTKVCVLQLLALSWIFINNDQYRLCGLEDGINKFIVALYDMQRGKNQNDNFDDQDITTDLPICEPGHFNKGTESFWGITDCAALLINIIFMTKETASGKLPMVVRDVVKNYLQKNPEKVPQIQSLSQIWQHISATVSQQMRDEFFKLYNNDIEFKLFVQQGIETDIDDIIAAAKNPKLHSKILVH